MYKPKYILDCFKIRKASLPQRKYHKVTLKKSRLEREESQFQVFYCSEEEEKKHGSNGKWWKAEVMDHDEARETKRGKQ